MPSHSQKLAVLTVIVLVTTLVAETSVFATGGTGSFEEAGVIAVVTEAIDTQPPEAVPDQPVEPTAPTIQQIDPTSYSNEIGPVGFVDIPTYEAIWLPDELTPSAITIDVPDTNVDLITADALDDSSFAVLLVLNSADSSTEFRFNNAIPNNHTAVIQEDGSVKFQSKEGNFTSGITAPWAYDANGVAVPTGFTFDGTTLVQEIEHHGFDYPIIADPNWWKVVKGAMVASAGIAAIAAKASACAGTVIGCLSFGVTPSTSFMVSYGASNIVQGIREQPPHYSSTLTPGRGICRRFSSTGSCRG